MDFWSLFDFESTDACK